MLTCGDFVGGFVEDINVAPYAMYAAATLAAAAVAVAVLYLIRKK